MNKLVSHIILEEYTLQEIPFPPIPNPLGSSTQHRMKHSHLNTATYTYVINDIFSPISWTPGFQIFHKFTHRQLYLHIFLFVI